MQTTTIAPPAPRIRKSRSEEAWLKRPDLPDSHYVDSRIYTDPKIFAEEMDRIWRRVWLPVCHESELPEALDFRSLGTFDNTPLVVVRGSDKKIRTFLNICPHRGNRIVRSPSGNLGVAEPSGNPKNMTCMFHGWQFDAEGRCVEITREKAGYQDRVCKADVGLREIRTEIAHGGFVWIALDDDAPPLREFIGGAFGFMATELDTEPLEIFHYQKSLVKTNYKLWHETSREFYHDYLHYHNRATGMLQPGYFDRKYTVFENGHAATGLTTINYEAYDGSKERVLTFPGMPKNGWKQLNIFPGCTYSLRASCLRVSVMTPISENEVLIELRGLGLKADTPKEREQRIADHDTIWGPFGRNLHEDLLVVQQQKVAMQPGSGSRFLLMAREEGDTIHDEIGLRSYYDEWARRMGRVASRP
ncbi:aromatic ring-hydroxylating oxygenase subunit alpha [Caenimonas soli]|uniref:aromatic ring-hydroxylating oxygenase subunit alpha n=1 Tax=Caenimonas soli TaxID=2735555 RepID=UPI0015570A01|nr:aromatic ring-hydroxylating dioxygenase subunit alpha [Caenimonas soli]NPC59131.1 aromatic ring-hydroxylating dioxygenase subunit alpha [Caenimonas soli]